MSSQLAKKIDKILTGLPEEIKENVGKKKAFYEGKGFSENEIFDEIKNLVKLELLAYTETKREYIGLYNQKFSQRKTFWYIKEIIARKPLLEKDFYSFARLDFDMNGLKALNDLSGDYSVGSESLRVVSTILEKGKTTKWLREKGLEVFVSIEGGDEYGVLIYGDMDLRQFSNEIINRYFKEVKETDVSHLLDFNNPDVRERLRTVGLDKEIDKDFKLGISISVGISFFAEALHLTDFDRATGMNENIRNIRRKLFDLAHMRSLENKRWYKRYLYDNDPVLAALYARMNSEVVELSRENKVLKEKIKELESNG